MKTRKSKNATTYGLVAKRTAILCALIISTSLTCLAQTDMDGTEFLTGFKDALFENFPIAASICYGIAGIIGIVGAVKIAGKIQSGGQQVDVSKEIGYYVGGVLFFCVAAAMAQKFFS